MKLFIFLITPRNTQNGPQKCKGNSRFNIKIIESICSRFMGVLTSERLVQFGELSLATINRKMHARLHYSVRQPLINAVGYAILQCVFGPGCQTVFSLLQRGLQVVPCSKVNKPSGRRGNITQSRASNITSSNLSSHSRYLLIPRHHG